MRLLRHLDAASVGRTWGVGGEYRFGVAKRPRQTSPINAGLVPGTNFENTNVIFLFPVPLAQPRFQDAFAYNRFLGVSKEEI